MANPSQYLQALARTIADHYADLPTLKAAMVTGSAAKALSDFYSDLDFTFYYDRELPSEETLTSHRESLGGSARKWLIGDRVEGGFAEAFDLHGIEVQIGHTTIDGWEQQIDSVLIDYELDNPTQKALEGTLACIPLIGEPLINSWKERLGRYPDGLAEAMVKKHLAFFPIWGLEHHFKTRDPLLWGHQIMVEACYNIVGVLAGLNHLYFTTFQFKRVKRFIDQMTIKPDNLYDRLQQLLTRPPVDAAADLEQLVSETIELVETHLPIFDTTAAKRRIGWRQAPWEMEEV